MHEGLLSLKKRLVTIGLNIRGWVGLRKKLGWVQAGCSTGANVRFETPRAGAKV